MAARVVRPWPAFALVSLAFFMVVLDFSIVSIAIPEIQSGLHMTPGEAQWILSIYMLIFAGFLMLCGSLADLFGRRRFFLAGVALFGAASLAAGFSNDGLTLILLRAAQGLGAAMCNPSGLAIATTLFAAGPERNRAVGLWAAVGSAGRAVRHDSRRHSRRRIRLARGPVGQRSDLARHLDPHADLRAARRAARDQAEAGLRRRNLPHGGAAAHHVYDRAHSAKRALR